MQNFNGSNAPVPQQPNNSNYFGKKNNRAFSHASSDNQQFYSAPKKDIPAPQRFQNFSNVSGQKYFSNRQIPERDNGSQPGNTGVQPRAIPEGGNLYTPFQNYNQNNFYSERRLPQARG